MTKSIFTHLRSILSVVVLLSAGIVSAEITKIDVDLDRESHVYALGETATFSISVLDENGKPIQEGTVQAVFQNTFQKELKRETIDLSKQNPVTVPATMDEPGFLTVTVSGNKIYGRGGAAFSPEKIEPGQEMPEDFWSYWRGLQKKLRAEVSGDLKLEKIDSISDDQQTTYRVSMATFNDKTVNGFLSIPVGDGPFPLLVSVSWAGPGFGPAQYVAHEGFAALNMTMFPYVPGLTLDERQKQYDEFNAKLGIVYSYYGAPERDKYYFRDMYLGIDRVIDMVLERPDIDNTRVGYYGTSQGGGSALILGGLNGKFQFIHGSVPALCDHGAAKLGRQAGWPQIYRAVHDPKVEEMGPYFDGVNFAREIRCPIRLTVGFIDTTCSPSSVYAAFNVIPSADKAILHEEHRGHDVGKKHGEIMNWLKKSVRGE